MSDRTILVPGETCWRIDRADKMKVIIDGEDYFRIVKQALLRAERNVMMIGWDFDPRIAFEPNGATLDGPNQLGDFIKWLLREKADLDLYLLKWDVGELEGIKRGMLPMVMNPIRMAPNFHFALDGQHPHAAAHHSKIIVVDDALAFCGGIDVTAGRWDTRAHIDDQPHRHLPGDVNPSQPWHDVAALLSGMAAAALGDLARERWFRATSESLDPPNLNEQPRWPEGSTTFDNIPIAVARTYPDYNGYDEVREIEALYLKAVAESREVFYVETQYFASAKIARAMARRLQDPDGPEFILILPRSAEGWLERKAMDGARAKLLRHLWSNDPHNRFAAYYPVTDQGNEIYVHAKVLTVDNRLLRIGSSNLNNRSMGFDTECDVAIEAGACSDPDQVGQRIDGLRQDLIAEHLNVDRKLLEATIKEHGFIGAIERLRGSGKTLRPFTRSEIAEEDDPLTENEYADPESAEGGALTRMVKGLKDYAGNLVSRD